MKANISLLAIFSWIVASVGHAQGAAAPSNYREGADEVVEQWTAALGPRFRELAVLPENEFVIAWRQELNGWRRQLRAVPGYRAGSKTAERYDARILYEWAIGRLLYPEFHAGLTRSPDFIPSDGYDAYLEELDFTRGDFLDLEEYADFLVRKRNQDAMQLIANENGRFDDGVRDLSAQRLVNEEFANQDVRCFLERDALSDWLEDFAADGLTNEPDTLASSCPGPETDQIIKLVAGERSDREGHPIRVYTTANGHDLELHIFSPSELAEPAPAVVWLHGGGWYSGSWSWCGPCIWLKERGLVVAQVEYRVQGRHGSTIPDSYADALAAIEWMRANASEFNVDPNRIAVAGFSAGGHLALSAATFAAEGPARPDLAISISGCTDLTNDSYSVRLAGGEDSARDFSPRLKPSAVAPPTFLANGGRDRLCSFEEAVDFVDRVRAIGGSIEFHPEPDGEHFFLRDEGRAGRTKKALFEFLEQHAY